jgi:DNA helicase-2/ATP-dependent DNA helicase PcrA
MRRTHGQTQFNNVSRFIAEIPKGLLEAANSLERKMKESMSLAEAVGQRRETFRKKPYQTQSVSSIPVPGGIELDYAVGDKVSHIKFGTGVVKEIRSGGRDFEVTVEFDRCGIKKMFASFAKLKKLD